MPDRPRVSVVVATYQSESRIGSTLARLGRQSYTDFEVIVVNDGSTDQTSASVRRAIAADPRIRLVEQPNRGTAAGRNRGVAVARGDVVAFLDDDDLWHPRKLELQLARLDANPQASVVSCYSALVDPTGRLLGWRMGGPTEGLVYREMLEWDMVSGGSVVMASRRSVEESGGFDAAVGDRADWDLWIRLARRHAFGFVPEVLVGYTRRTDSMSGNYDRMVQSGHAVLDKARRDDPSIEGDRHRALLARDLFGVACFGLVDGRNDAAWRYLARSVQLSPRLVLARPRRWGVILMLILSTVLPRRLYGWAMAAVSRGAFRFVRGQTFDSLP